MKRKVVTGITLTVTGITLILFIGMLTLMFNVQPVKASGTIYIRADGSIDPPTANITTADNITYTFTSNINAEHNAIVLERDNIVVDGAGYTLQGTGADGSRGIQFSGRSNVTIKNMEITAYESDIFISSSSNITISGNNITNSQFHGVRLISSSNNTISGNSITNNYFGVGLYQSSNNTVSGNNITANGKNGIYLHDSSNGNNISGNNITNNYHGIWLEDFLNHNNISGNTITNNDYGVRSRQSSNNTVSGNTITNSGYYGILFHSSSNCNNISGNTLTNNTGGIKLSGSPNNTISGNTITNNDDGVGLYQSSNNTVSGNTITNNDDGIDLDSSSNYNTISGNNVINNSKGIHTDWWTSNNTISGNNIANNYHGIYLQRSSNNSIYYNNFIDNTQQVYISPTGYANIWDDGYPSGGNFWSDYTGVDLFSGPYQNETGGDGIGDTPCVIDANNTDHYPLMNAWTWAETIYIRADGSIEPDTAPISTVDNITYTLTDNIVGDVPEWTSAIVVERDNIVVDGASFTVQGTGAYRSVGISLDGRNSVTIRNMEITGFDHGIYIHTYSSYNNICGNNITNTDTYGIWLSSSSNNIVSGNDVTANDGFGIYIFYSSNNSICENDITANNIDGIWVSHSPNNTISGNNITANNSSGIYLQASSSSNNSISGNNITNNEVGIYFSSSSSNAISGNNITNNTYGVRLLQSSNNTVSGNNITENNCGIYFDSSDYNSISGNIITNNQNGILLYGSSNNNTISGNNITANNDLGIWLLISLNNTISGNTITNNDDGVSLASSSYNNTISGNNITNNTYGVYLREGSNNNTVSGNNITNNTYGVRLDQSSNNKFYHNNFINNTQQVYIVTSGYANIWDDGYPSGGNFWSDYTGVDLFSGPYQNETGGDGIGDTPCVIDANNTDHYPLMNSWPDTTPPTISILSPQNTTYPTSSVPLTFTVNEATSWIGYSLDNQANVTILGNTTLTGLAIGPHNIIVYANDTYGNMGSSSKVYFTRIVNDVAILNVTASPTETYVNQIVNINVTVENKGTVSETFNVTAYYDSNPIDTQTIVNLAPGSNTTITFSWNTSGVQKGTYTISAEAEVVSGETNTTDNTYIDNTVTILDSPPTIDSYTPADLEPQVDEGNSLEFTHISSDPDDDPLTYSWLLDSVEQSTAQNWTYSPGYDDDGTHNVTLVVSDGELTDSQQWNVTVINVNRPPTAPVVDVTPNSPVTTDDVTCTVTTPSTDLDSDTVTYFYEWYKNGILQQSLTTVTTNLSVTISSSNTTKGEVWRCVVTPNDGTVNGTSAFDEVTILNSPPTQPTVDVTPDYPVTTDDLICTIAVNSTDPDGDIVTYTYEWYKNDVLQPSLTNLTTIDSSYTAKGEVWKCVVTPHGSDGPPDEDEVIIQNTAPTASNLDITPSSPKTGDDLTASYTYYDADNDTASGSEIRWYKDDILQPAYNDQLTVPSSATAKDQDWYFTVKPKDGTDFGTLQTSPTVTIGNTPPSIDGVDITPDPAYTNTDLTATPSGWSDPDNDPPSYSYQWQKWNGANWQNISGATSNTLSSSNFAKGDQIKIICTPYDGADYGSSTEEIITISNSPPTQPTVDVTPDSPVTGDDLTCTVVVPSTDPDLGDTITYTYEWYRDQGAGFVLMPDETTVTTALSDTVSSTKTAKGDVWKCIVTPNDGTENGPSDEDQVTIGNTPPTAPVVDVTPNSPFTTDDLTCTVTTPSTDPDEDPITYTYAWYRNGELQSELTTVTTELSVTINSSGTTKGEVWRCVVTPNDGTVNGSTDQDEVTIGNSPPSIDGVNITPDPAYTDHTLTATPHGWLDADGDPEGYIYQWQKWDGDNWEDIPSATLSTLDSSYFVKGDQIKVICTPFDETDYGTSKEDTITISNSHPTVDSFTPIETTPEVNEGNILEFTHTSSDPDDDTLTYSWLLDSVEQSTAQNWTYSPDYDDAGIHNVTLVVSDGVLTDSQEWNVTVVNVNRAPVIDAFYPSTNSTITEEGSQEFNITYHDLDEDPVLVQWYLNGAPTSTLDNYTFVAGYDSAGVYNVTVVVSDGLAERSHEWTLTVLDVNRAPTIDSYTPEDLEPTVNEGDSLNFTQTSSDPDGDPLFYSWLLDNMEQATTQNWTYTPGHEDSGFHNVTLVVSDGELTDSQEWNVTIIDVNRAPVIDTSYPSTDPTIGEVESQEFNITYHDPDRDPVTVQWYLNGTPTVNTASYIFNADHDSAGVYNVTVVISDNELTDSREWTLTVLDVNRPPTIDSYYPLTNPTMKEGEIQEFNITKSDLDGDPLTVTWWLNQSDTGETSDSYTYTANYESAGTYNVTVIVSDGLSQTSHQWTLTVTSVERDITILNVIPSKNIVGGGYSVSINITLANQGDLTETFNVTAYANTTVIETMETILTSGNSTTIIFTWNTTTFDKGNYTISAYAWPVPGETYTTDNNKTDGWVVVTILGDINGDRIVDIVDLTIASLALWSEPGDPDWNPIIDLNQDGIVDIVDLTIVAIHLWETW